MLKVKPIIQKTAMCGPACLAMVMGYFGKEVSLARVIRASRATKTRGLLPGGYRRAAKAFGFHVSIQDHATVHDIHEALQEGIPPIVNWFSVDEGHYSVVVGITTTKITLIDPETGKLHSMPLTLFKRIWFGVDPEPARTIHDFHLRRLILLRPGLRTAARQKGRAHAAGSRRAPLQPQS